MIKSKSIREYYNDEPIVKGYEKGYEKSSLYPEIINSLKKGSRVLSLGCGGGREVMLLLKRKQQVTAVDFAENMISQSRKLAPQADYFCEDAVSFAERNKNKMKFDYILGLFTFLCYIKRKDRQVFIDNTMSMLKPDGTAIFTVHYVMNGWKDFIKSLVAPPFAWYFEGRYEFGDTCFNLTAGNCTIAHHFTRGQIRKLFRKYDIRLEGNKIFVKHKLTNINS